jgi:hypothetical protein
MRSTMLTYPGFQTLPRGVKRMLLESESFFFGEAKSWTAKAAPGKLAIRISLGGKAATHPTRQMPTSQDARRD